jgi:hypothetical protein
MRIFHRKADSIPASLPGPLPPERVCGKCGITSTAVRRGYEEAERRGVYFVSPPGLMVCADCDKYFCPSCQVDLGLDSGCPICGERLCWPEMRKGWQGQGKRHFDERLSISGYRCRV